MIDLSLDLRGVDALIANNKRFLREVTRALKNSLTRTLRRTRTTVQRDIRTESSLGRKIWGRSASGLKSQGLVSIIEPKGEGDGIVTGLRFKGIPRLLEDGGRIKAHRIKAREGRLVFEVGGKTIYARAVKHPGGPVHKHGFGSRRLRENERLIADDVNRSIQNTVNQVYENRGGDFEIAF